MSSSRTRLIKSIESDFTSKHTRSSHVYIPRRKADRLSLGSLGIAQCDPATTPDVIIHDQERDWLFLFDAGESGRYMDEVRRETLTAQFAPSGKGLVFLSAFADRDTFSRFAEFIAWETEIWVADNPTHMIHYNGDRFYGPRES